MIENIAITKTGLEALNSQKTQFQSTTDWEVGGANLVVYRNGLVNHKNENYSIVNSNTIQFNTPLEDEEQVMMLITKLTQLPKSDQSDLDRVYKKIEGKTQTSVEKEVYEESISSSFIIHVDEIWADDIDPEPSNAVALSVAHQYNSLELTEDLTVPNKQGWFASSNSQLSGRIQNWIPPRFGQKYIIRLYDSNNVEIPSSSQIMWRWDYQSGYLYIQNEHTLQTPLKISGYSYTGAIGTSDSTSHWKPPVSLREDLPSFGNINGDTRIVLEDNSIWTWNSISSEWLGATIGTEIKSQVELFSQLPLSSNATGDIRLVYSEKTFYRWTGIEWEALKFDHTHDDRYYTETEINNILEDYVTYLHEHDSLYYRKSEVDEAIRWRPSVSDEDHLPPYTENVDGDCILTRDNNIVWRWHSPDPNVDQGEWKPISASNLYWKEPLQSKEDLPDINLIVGQVHLILDEGIGYFWDGTEWLTLGLAEHDHDELYYRKHYIDSIIHWKPPVNSFSSLPLVENMHGDVRLTLDNNFLYRWDESSHEWLLVSASPHWKSPVDYVVDLPITENEDGDVRAVKETFLAYMWNEDTQTWNPMGLQEHDHDNRYYTEDELSTQGVLDSRYYVRNHIDELFDTIIGHSHDGVDSRRIDYNNLENIYWKAPVVDFTDLPLIENNIGDARIVFNDNKIYTWTGVEWIDISGLSEHDHDDRYYTETEVDNILDTFQFWITNELANKADLYHDHDDRYYLKSEVDSFFDPVEGHRHDGTDSPRISYYDLVDTPNFDERYYTQTQLQTSGQSEVNWGNIVGAPNFGGSWRTPVQGVSDLPDIDNSVGDLRLVLDDSDVYEWNGSEWIFVGHWELPGVHFWESPVINYIDLPVAGNQDGDVRLVKTENRLYRWDNDTQIWVALMGGGSSPGLSAANNIQVYLNGNQLLENVEWKVESDNSVKLLIPLEIDDKIAILVWGSNFNRYNYVVSDPLRDEYQVNPSYWRQDVVITSPTSTFNIPTPYVVAGANLILWVNGLIQKLGRDYNEIDEFTFQFVQPLNVGDTLIVVVLGSESGEGEYIREDYVAIYGKTEYDLVNEYSTGSGNLLVYYNGLLQEALTDYQETDAKTVTFTYPHEENDLVSFIIIEGFGSGGSGDCCQYFREDFTIGFDGQRVIALVNEYLPGENELIVYLNGILQRISLDYIEKDSHSIEFVLPLHEDDLITVMLITGVCQGVSGGGGLVEIPNACAINLGTPTDGLWTDGLLPFVPSYKTCDAIDDINETLLQMAPPKPTSFHEMQFELQDLVLYSGYVSNGNTNYEYGPGFYHSYLTEDEDFQLMSPSEDYFSDSDKGKIEVYINDVKMDEFNLGNAFVEANRMSTQTSMSYGILAQGASADVGVSGTNGAIRNSSSGLISIMSVEKYNNFSLWQKGQIRINIYSGLLRKGYNRIHVRHRSDSFNHQSKIVELFLDTSKTRPEIYDPAVFLTNTEINSTKYVSGIRYHSIGDKFRSRMNVLGAFNNTYKQAPVEIDMPGLKRTEIEWDDEDISGVSSPPEIGEILDYDGIVTLNQFNEYSINARMEISTFDPFGSGEVVSTEAVNRLVNTYTNGSTDLIEHFRDELYRLPESNYDALPIDRKNQWDSQQLLTNGQAMLFDRKLQFANINFLVGYRPQPQQANYSSFTDPQTYYRSFFKQGIPKNSGEFTIEGITEEDLLENRILIDIKLPTQTGWMSFNKNYDVSVFQGLDGDGCFLNSNSNSFTYSSGTYSTANSGWMIILRITLLSAATPSVSYMELHW